jgi:dienelactone hydrolase
MLTHNFTSAAALILMAAGVASFANAQATESLNHADLSYFVNEEGVTRPVRTVDEWRQRRRAILKSVQDVMGPLPNSQPRAPLDVQVIEEVETPKYVRRKITYVPETGDRVPAYLLVPRGEPRRRPAMLCLHQTTDIGKGEPAGLGGLDSLHYAHELAERGFVCLVPDYPSFGDYSYDFNRATEPFVSGSMKAIWNNIRGVDLLSELPDVDAERIGVIGHSLGGHNAIFTAVFDERLKAVVTSCGFTGFRHYYGGNLQGWTSDRYMPRIREVYGNDPRRVPFDFHELIAAIAPRAVFVSAPLHDDNFEVQGVREVIAAAAPIFRLHGVEARLRAEFPDAPHEFPETIRDQAYDWLQKELSEAPGN